MSMIDEQLSKYVKRKGWTLDDYLKHDKDVADSFVDKFGQKLLDQKISDWHEAQSRSEGWRPSKEDFVTDLQEWISD